MKIELSQREVDFLVQNVLPGYCQWQRDGVNVADALIAGMEGTLVRQMRSAIAQNIEDAKLLRDKLEGGDDYAGFLALWRGDYGHELSGADVTCPFCGMDVEPTEDYVRLHLSARPRCSVYVRNLDAKAARGGPADVTR